METQDHKHNMDAFNALLQLLHRYNMMDEATDLFLFVMNNDRDEIISAHSFDIMIHFY